VLECCVHGNELSDFTESGIPSPAELLFASEED
jgi:hypothetical protein